MIIASLSKPLSELARQSIFDIENAIPTVQAIIILSLALKESEPDVLFPSRLWAYCVKVFQRRLLDSFQKFTRLMANSSSLYDGLPSPLMMSFGKLDWNELIFNGLPHIVSYEHRLHHALKDATSSIMKTIDLGSNMDSCVLNSLVGYFDQKAYEVTSRESGDLRKRS